MQPDIQDDDYVISDARSGYNVSTGATRPTNYDQWDDAVEAIIQDMDLNQFYPSVWFINDHGNTDLLSVNHSTGQTEVLESWV